MSKIDLQAARSNFSLADGLVYLDHAAQGPLPLSARRAYNLYLDRWQGMGERHKSDIFEIVERVRGKLATIIKAAPDRLGLSATTTYGLNVIAGGYPWVRGDNVVVSDGDFPANVYPWRRLRSMGVELRFAATEGGFIDEDKVKAVCDNRTRVVGLSWVQFNNGCRVDLGRLGRFCRENGILFCVDGIQGTGAVSVDVPSLDIDLFTCGCQKWLFGPCGTAFFYLSERAEAMINPPLMGWLSVDWGAEFSDLLRYDLPPRKGPSRYEIGTYPFQDLFALDASLEFIMSYDAEARWERIRSLTDRIIDFAVSSPRYTLVSPTDESRRSGIVSIRTVDSRSLLDRLTEQNFAVSFRENSVRISPHFYNSPEEIDRLLESLEGFRGQDPARRPHR